MFVERLIYQVLEDGVAFLVANPGEISSFLSTEANLPDDEADAVAQAFLDIKGKNGARVARPGPSVVHGYARQDNAFPLYAITLGGEQEAQTFMGDAGHMVDDPEDDNYGADQFAAIFNYTVNVLVYAQHPDMVLYLYQLMKEILVAALPLLKSYDLFDIRLGGADMAPDPAWVPAGLFVRRATLTFSREYRQTQAAARLGRAWAVQSIHVDADGAVGESVGGVQTHVTVRGTPDTGE
jgi:hypothetical protein